jgi:hypothetical protein
MIVIAVLASLLAAGFSTGPPTVTFTSTPGIGLMET